MNELPRHSVSVAGAIFNTAATHVLLIERRDNDAWEPPGGILELDESIEDGLRREIREETGVEVEVEHLTGVYKNLARGIVAMVFRCTALTEPALKTPEAKRVAWVQLDRVENLVVPAYAVRILDALRPGNANIRSHDGNHLLDSTGKSLV